MLLGYLGEFFCGLGGSWEQFEFLADFGIVLGTTKIQVAGSSDA